MMIVQCPLCGQIWQVASMEALKRLQSEHLLSNTACSESLLNTIVEGGNGSFRKST